MNINNVYIASIWMLVDSRLIGDIWTDGEFKMKLQYVKTTAVYEKNDKWYDLETKKEYNYFRFEFHILTNHLYILVKP